MRGLRAERGVGKGAPQSWKEVKTYKDNSNTRDLRVRKAEYPVREHTVAHEANCGCGVSPEEV